MRQVSELTGKIYYDEDVYYFKNYVQAAHYVAWGAKLVDISVGDDMKFTYVFLKEDHARLKHKWIRKNNEYHANGKSGGQSG